MNEEDKVIVPVEVLNKVLGVLASLPFSQVSGVINELQQSVEPVTEPDQETLPGME